MQDDNAKTWSRLRRCVILFRAQTGEYVLMCGAALTLAQVVTWRGRGFGVVVLGVV